MEGIKLNQEEKERSKNLEEAKKLFDYLQNQSKSLANVAENPLLLKHGEDFINTRINLGKLIEKYELTDEEIGGNEQDFTKFALVGALIQLAKKIHE